MTLARMAVALMLASLTAICFSRDGAVSRPFISLNTGWKFSIDKGSNLDASPVVYDDSSWRTVNLPHDYVVEQQFQAGLDAQHGSLPTPIGWYRKHLYIAKQKGREVWLNFDDRGERSPV